MALVNVQMLWPVILGSEIQQQKFRQKFRNRISEGIMQYWPRCLKLSDLTLGTWQTFSESLKCSQKPLVTPSLIISSPVTRSWQQKSSRWSSPRGMLVDIVTHSTITWRPSHWWTREWIRVLNAFTSRGDDSNELANLALEWCFTHVDLSKTCTTSLVIVVISDNESIMNNSLTVLQEITGGNCKRLSCQIYHGSWITVK